ncbi:MAG: ATP-binding protein [Jatrophihabitans sp.]
MPPDAVPPDAVLSNDHAGAGTPAVVVKEHPWTLRGRLGVAFGSVALAIAVLASAVLASAVLFAQSGNEVIYRWQPAVAANRRLVIDLVDQETVIRGYALTGRESSISQFPGFVDMQRADAKQLRELIGGDKRLGGLVDDFYTAIDAWRTRIALPAIEAIRAGRPEGVQIVQSKDAQNRFDQVRERADVLLTALVARADDTRNARRIEGAVFGVAGGLLIVLVLALGLVLWRGLQRWVLDPVDRLAVQTRLVASGQTRRRILPDGPQELTDLGRDVEGMRQQIASELARAEAILDELKVRTAELDRSNNDLQQFAYVASHDLSEPLRKVANFCQLLERQYGPQLDDRARQYIDFAVDGAKRMQVLISDLLALSRVGRSTEQFVPVDLNAAFAQAVANLGAKVPDTAQVLVATPLPTVLGDRSLLTSLLENLIGNALKYRREDVEALVVISTEHGPDGWTFSVVDNGIGIESQYAERIFAVFQRLHLRDQYGGTGIGLALCRKIVEFHGGLIWLADVESATAGATFRFTLPEGAVRVPSQQ